jgi:hypothetical protein
VRAWSLGVAVALAALSPARAKADLALAAPSCEGLDLASLRALLEVEIGDVAAEWREVSTPVVLLGCADDRVRLEITDPVTDKSVARTIQMPEVDRERVLAIAIAQLFLTSWVELLIDEGAATGPGAEAAERRARAVIDAAIAEEPARAPEPPTMEPPTTREARSEQVPAEETVRVRIKLALDGGVRMRTDGEQLVTALGALRAMLVVDGALLVGLRAGFEWGRAERQRGTIDLYGGALGLVAGWRSPALGPLSLDVVAIASLAALALEGHPGRAGVIGGTTIALVGEATLELAPSLRAGPVSIALPLAATGMAFAPDGEITGEAPIVAGGLIVSAALRISIAASL